MMHQKPRVFIGSSSLAWRMATAIQHQLGRDSAVTRWEHGPAEFGPGTLDWLDEKLQSYDLAIIVACQGDFRRQYRIQRHGPPNLYLSLKALLRRLGPQRTLLVHDGNGGVALPAGIARVTTFAHGPCSSSGIESTTAGIRRALQQATATSLKYKRNDEPILAEKVDAGLLETCANNFV